MNPILWLLPGVLVGAAESVLTGAIAKRVLRGQMPVLLLVGKVASWAAILLSVFFLLSRSGAMWFGIGAGGGVLAAGLSISVYTLAKEKR